MRLVVTLDGVKHAVPVLIEFGFVHNYVKVIFDNKRVVKPMLDYMSPNAQMIENLAALLIAQVQTCGVGELDCIQIDSRYLTGGVGQPIDLKQIKMFDDLDSFKYFDEKSFHFV